MRLRLRSFLLTSALTFAPAVASATTISGLYVDGGSGYNEVQDQHVHANSPYANSPAVQKFSVNHGTGFTGFGAVGYGFGNGLRVEAEGLYNFSHDNYTSSYTEHYTENQTVNTTLQNYYKQMDKPFYTMVPGATPVNCNSGSNPFYANGVDTTQILGTGNPYDPAQGITRDSTTTKSDSWQYTPADKCFVISNQTEYESYAKWAGSWSNNQPLFSYPVPGTWYPPGWTGNEGINPEPGIYSNTTGNMINYQATSTFSGQFKYQNAYGEHCLGWSNANMLTPIPYSYTQTIHRMMNLPINHQGTDESWGGFANVLYDFDLERLFGLRSIVTPFVGGGAGYLWQRYNNTGPAAAAITGTHGGFAWQGIAGVAFDTGISGLQITAQYRMIGQPGSFYNGAFNYGTEGGHANFDQRFNHQFIVGFRYAFHNQPVHHIQPPAVRPIVAAAPAPVPARSYLVFFDWNQYALTSRARQIVVEAAHATSYVHTTRINVNGYTDSSAAPGPAGQKYNYALSVKRARSVEAELIRNGVPASEIVIRGYGDTNPLVPTGPNTREPQNRRVEIILHA